MPISIIVSNPPVADDLLNVIANALNEIAAQCLIEPSLIVNAKYWRYGGYPTIQVESGSDVVTAILRDDHLIVDPLALRQSLDDQDGQLLIPDACKEASFALGDPTCFEGLIAYCCHAITEIRRAEMIAGCRSREERLLD